MLDQARTVIVQPVFVVRTQRKAVAALEFESILLSLSLSLKAVCVCTGASGVLVVAHERSQLCGEVGIGELVDGVGVFEG